MPNDLIENFIAQYRKQYVFYDEAGRLAAKMLAGGLKETGIRSIVTSRAKALEGLKAKVRARSPRRNYRSVDDIFEDIVDLAGVRVAMYFPGEDTQADRIIQDLFLLQGKPKTFPDRSTKAAYEKRFSGYHATHYRVRLRKEDLKEQHKDYADPRPNPLRNSNRRSIRPRAVSPIETSWSARFDDPARISELSGNPGHRTERSSSTFGGQGMNEFCVICKSRKDTAFVAAAIAPSLRPGDAIMLKGALAGGKTAFVQELVTALGSEADVTSPTFTLAHFYPTRAGMFLHVDAYRLSSIVEYRDLGLDDYTFESITAVEWGNIVEEDFPGSLSIVFEFVEVGDTYRKLTFSASTDRWRPILHRLWMRLSSHLKI